MTEPKQSIADSLDPKIGAYDESFGANAARAAQKAPIIGDAYKSIADSAKGFQQADGADELAAAAARAADAAADLSTRGKPQRSARRRGRR